MGEPSGAWPPPSESARVRGLLTFAEGLVVGSGLGFVFLIGSAFTVTLAGPSPVTVGVGVLLAVFLALTVRNLWIFGLGRHSGRTGPASSQTTSR